MKGDRGGHTSILGASAVCMSNEGSRMLLWEVGTSLWEVGMETKNDVLKHLICLTSVDNLLLLEHQNKLRSLVLSLIHSPNHSTRA